MKWFTKTAATPATAAADFPAGSQQSTAVLAVREAAVPRPARVRLSPTTLIASCSIAAPLPGLEKWLGCVALKLQLLVLKKINKR